MVRKFGLALLAASAIAAGSVALDTPAHAQAGVAVGVLTCNVSSGFGFIFGSSRELNCTYSNGEHYVGQINKYGVDIGFTKAAVIVWTVFAPTTNFSLPARWAGITAAPPPAPRPVSGLPPMR